LTKKDNLAVNFLLLSHSGLLLEETALSSPQASSTYTSELPAKDKLILAFKSLSPSQPQLLQWKVLSDRDSFSLTVPQLEQVLDDGNHLSTTIN
jgi:anaerobic glycerol-3-phosphate dehydrogenase